MPKDKKMPPAEIYKSVVNEAEKGYGKADFWKALGDTDYNPDNISIVTYQKMLSDAQVFAASQVGTLAVLAKGYDFEYKGEDKELGDKMLKYIRKAFTDVNRNYYQNGGMWFVMRELMHNARSFGYSVGETVFGEYNEFDDGYVYPKKVKVLPPTTLKDCFTVSDYGDIEKITQNRNSEFEVTWEGKNDLYRMIVYSHNKEWSNPYGRSDLKVNYKNWFTKDYLIKFWNIELERYGAPFLIGKVSNPAHIADMNKALDSARTKTNFSIWKNDEVDIIESSNAQNAGFSNAIKYHDVQIMIGQVTPTLLMGVEASGARSLGDIHFRVFLWKVKSDQMELADVMNAQIRKWIDMNFSDVDVYPELKWPLITNEDLTTMADAVYKLITAQVIAPDEKWIRDTLSIPQNDQLDKTGGIVQPVLPGQPGQVVDTQKISAPLNQPGQPKPAVQPQKNQTLPTREKGTREYKPGERKNKIAAYRPNYKIIKNMLQKQDSNLMKIYETYLRQQKSGVIGSRADDKGFVDKVKLLLLKFSNDIVNYETDMFDNMGIEIDSEFSREALDKLILNLSKQSFKDSVADIADKAKQVVLDGENNKLSKEEIAANVSQVYDTYINSQLETVVRTIVDDVHNASRLELYQNNRDFVQGVKFDAVMDEGTTPLCEGYNGMTLSLDNPDIEALRPPLHFQCRSMYTPVTILDGRFEETYQPGDVYPDPEFGGKYFTEKYGEGEQE